MKTICDVDKNFLTVTGIDKQDAMFYRLPAEPFQINGVFYADGKFRRLPESVASATSSAVHFLHANTAGGRLRFRTDSSYVAISVKMENICKMSHFAMTGSAGFDLYADEGDSLRYIASFRPPIDMDEGFQSVVELGAKKMRSITIHFPLYSDVTELIVGIQEEAQLAPPEAYRNRKPIVYYGSSITQGGCASRPGNAYPNIISRVMGIDHINLGFSGSAKAEDPMIEYIQNLDMSLFVFDYDHNAPTIEYLAQTHEKMFRAIRAHHPELPIVILSRPKLHLTEEEQARLRIIQATYQNALDSGDTHVYFIPGPALMEGTGNDGTVDLNHPNDLGFHAMARVLGEQIRQIL